MDESGIFPLVHPNALFEQGIRQSVRPDRNRALETKTFQEKESLRIDGATRPTMRGEGIRRTAVANNLIQSGHELIAAERRLKGGDKQAMIAACDSARNGSRSEASDAVGDEPLARFRVRQIAADFAPETDQGENGRRHSTLRFV